MSASFRTNFVKCRPCLALHVTSWMTRLVEPHRSTSCRTPRILHGVQKLSQSTRSRRNRVTSGGGLHKFADREPILANLPAGSPSFGRILASVESGHSWAQIEPMLNNTAPLWSNFGDVMRKAAPTWTNLERDRPDKATAREGLGPCSADGSAVPWCPLLCGGRAGRRSPAALRGRQISTSHADGEGGGGGTR